MSRENNPDELAPTRLSLIERLRDLDDQASWRTFFDMYWKLIYVAAIRSGLSDQEAEDAVQETIIGVARKMETFRYEPEQCSFKGWLMHVTRCRVADQFRKRKPRETALCGPDDGEDSMQLEDRASANLQETVWEEEWQRNLMDLALQRVRRQANPEHYQIFHLHAVKGLGVRQVADLMRVSIAKVYVTYHRMAKEVKAEVRRLEERGDCA